MGELPAASVAPAQSTIACQARMLVQSPFQRPSQGHTAVYSASLFIDGAWISKTASEPIEVVDPGNEQLLGTVPSAGPDEVAAAVAAAQRGLRSWKQHNPWDRSNALRRVGALIRERTEILVELVTLEIGKPRGESRIEVQACAEYFEWCADEARRIYGYTRAGRLPGSRFEVTHEPIGVVLALTAWNYPLILAARKLAMALAAGCSVILRPAEEAPACVAALVKCCADAELPAGAVNLLFGSPAAVVEPLMADPIVRQVSFTGSTRVGQLLIRQSAQTVKRLTLELGGHAPFIVLADADIEKAASTAVVARMRNAGQVCTSPSRFYVHESVAKPFAARMAELAGALRVGYGLDDATQMGPLATSRQRERAEHLVADARDKGGRIMAGGGRHKGRASGYYFEPTVITGLSPDARLLQEEPFSPIAAIVPVASIDEAVACANAVEFGLAAYVYGRSGADLDRVTEALEAGVIGVNNAAVAIPEMPFGGVKQSGYGREGGAEGVQDYLCAKFVHRMPS
jgi:succinate-semialdehyde dehydrogenase/glutarate-semialdehyde dehydrogenase